jgi:hypothetical protein
MNSPGFSANGRILNSCTRFLYRTHRRFAKWILWGYLIANSHKANTETKPEDWSKRLLQLASGTPDNLDSIFEPLRLEEPIELTRSKAKGYKPKSWLRIYAIKLQSNVYVVTGGAIKLTRSMQESEHTKIELRKFDRCRVFLREQGITDIDGLSELLL